MAHRRSAQHSVLSTLAGICWVLESISCGKGYFRLSLGYPPKQSGRLGPQPVALLEGGRASERGS